MRISQTKHKIWHIIKVVKKLLIKDNKHFYGREHFMICLSFQEKQISYQSGF